MNQEPGNSSKEEVSASELLKVAKRHGVTNPLAYRFLLSQTLDPDEDTLENFWDIVKPQVDFNKLFTSPFAKASNEVDGRFRFGVTELEGHAGLNPEECHVLIAGQTGCGKSTLLKLIFMQALQYKPSEE